MKFCGLLVLILIFVNVVITKGSLACSLKLCHCNQCTDLNCTADITNHTTCSVPAGVCEGLCNSTNAMYPSAGSQAHSISSDPCSQIRNSPAIIALIVVTSLAVAGCVVLSILLYLVWKRSQTIILSQNREKKYQSSFTNSTTSSKLPESSEGETNKGFELDEPPYPVNNNNNTTPRHHEPSEGEGIATPGVVMRAKSGRSKNKPSQSHSTETNNNDYDSKTVTTQYEEPWDTNEAYQLAYGIGNAN